MKANERNNGGGASGTRSLLRTAVAAIAAAALLTVGGSLQSCNTDGCTDNASALPLMAFYSMSTKTPIVLDSIDFGGVGTPDDSLLVKSGESVMNLYLPFRFEKESTTFRIHYDYKEQELDDPALDDVVTFYYTSRPYFASEECGAYYEYTIKKVEYTRHLIDSIGVSDSVITNVDRERIQVFIRTAEIDDGGDDTPEEGGEE